MPEREGDWRQSANCLKVDPELFFPVGSVKAGPGLEQANKAKAVCQKCDVIDECLTYALEHNQDSGIWGGQTEDERRAIKRRAHREQRARREVRLARGAMDTGGVY